MDFKVELVARALHEAEQETCLWDNEPMIRRERFREYARNAIKLLGEDIGVLLLALEKATAAEQVGDPRAAAYPPVCPGRH
ncbi:hypothetical protein DC522_10665 [Microvirga sp. KLBC 81]|uniref:hypothetical protein n=1 Tax=Microvirga sp. KLBC 81 TaxID=1862707 RepID=UPI000D50A885|nr:hypothetical protein [Microvirga sp. KLBC 81]PVE24328.1 hypothetical protein DC522_10665 [Microvirga sp. KLBC 81]